MENAKPIFISGWTGEYDYWSDKYKTRFKSHCIYALDDSGNVWKYIVAIRGWRKIEECSPPNFQFSDSKPDGFDAFGDI